MRYFKDFFGDSTLFFVILSQNLRRYTVYNVA